MTTWSPVISCHLSARPLKWQLRMRSRLCAPPTHTHSRSHLSLRIVVRHIKSVFCVWIDVFFELQKINLHLTWAISCTHQYVIAIKVRIFLQKWPLTSFNSKSKVGFLLGVCFVLPFVHYIQISIYILTDNILTNLFKMSQCKSNLVPVFLIRWFDYLSYLLFFLIFILQIVTQTVTWKPEKRWDCWIINFSIHQLHRILPVLLFSVWVSTSAFICTQEYWISALVNYKKCGCLGSLKIVPEDSNEDRLIPPDSIIVNWFQRAYRRQITPCDLCMRYISLIFGISNRRFKMLWKTI